MAKSPRPAAWGNVAALFGIGILMAATAYFAYMARESQPMWWYDALRGLVVFSCAMLFVIAYKAMGWWLIHAAIGASLFGIYVFGKYDKTTWGPINLVTAGYMGICALFALIGAGMSTWAINTYDGASEELSDDHFPHRPMTTEESYTIYQECLDFLNDPKRPKSFAVPESMLPRGGYPAIVEAFARVYADRYPTGSPEVLEHFKTGIAIFGISAPDWSVKAEAARLNTSTFQARDKGVYKAQLFASELQQGVTEMQVNWGSVAFAERVEELLERPDKSQS